MSELLLIGIGNISRGDDGMGWMFADDMDNNLGNAITVEKAFQLVVEDALKITAYDTVIFVDASENCFDGGFDFRKIQIPDEIKTEFTSHTQSPENIIFLASELFQHTVDAYVLEIGGQTWELGETLSDYGQQNLTNALKYFKQWWTENRHRHPSENLQHV